MASPTATFQNSYSGATEMALVPFRTSRGGVKVIRFRWTQANGRGCITTGFKASGFPTLAHGIAAAERHALFSNVSA